MNHKGRNEFAALELVILALIAIFFVWVFMKIMFF